MDVVTIEDETFIGHLNWWIYAIVIVTIFSIVLILNYIMKKINEARLESRATRLHSKASASQTIPVQSQPEQSVQAPIKINIVENPIPKIESSSTKGISLVFNKEANLLEDKRRKCVVDESNTINVDGKSDTSDYVSSVSVSGKSVTINTPEEIKPVYLGKIYEKRLNPNDSKIKIELPEAVNDGPSSFRPEIYQDVQYLNEIKLATSDDIVKIGMSRELMTIDQSIGLSKEDSSLLTNYDINDYTTGPIKIDHFRRRDNDSILDEIVDKVVENNELEAVPQKSCFQINRPANSSSVSISYPHHDKDDKTFASEK